MQPRHLTGAVNTELLDHISEANIQQVNQDYVGAVGLRAESFVRIVAFVIGEPTELDINEVLCRLTQDS